MQIAHGYQDGGVPKQLFHRDDIRAPIQYLSHLPHVRVTPQELFGCALEQSEGRRAYSAHVRL